MSFSISTLWSYYDVWMNPAIASPYTKRRALCVKTKALIAEDRLTQ